MLNIMKADLYRIFRSKGVYITTILFLAFVILQVAASSIGRIGVSTDIMPMPDIFKLTGRAAAFVTMNIVDNYLYFILPFIIFIAAVDFSSGAVKNVLATGMSRVELYFSKLILSFVFAFMLLILNIVVSIITATIINGFGGDFNIEFIRSILKVFLPQVFLVFAVVSMGIFLVFVTKKTAAVNGFYIAFCMVPMLLVFILSTRWADAFKMLDYELITNMRLMGSIGGATTTEMVRAYILSAVYITVSTVGGLMIFKRSEIK